MYKLKDSKKDVRIDTIEKLREVAERYEDDIVSEGYDDEDIIAMIKKETFEEMTEMYPEGSTTINYILKLKTPFVVKDVYNSFMEENGNLDYGYDDEDYNQNEIKYRKVFDSIDEEVMDVIVSYGDDLIDIKEYCESHHNDNPEKLEEYQDVENQIVLDLLDKYELEAYTPEWDKKYAEIEAVVSERLKNYYNELDTDYDEDFDDEEDDEEFDYDLMKYEEDLTFDDCKSNMIGKETKHGTVIDYTEDSIIVKDSQGCVKEIKDTVSEIKALLSDIKASVKNDIGANPITIKYKKGVACEIISFVFNVSDIMGAELPWIEKHRDEMINLIHTITTRALNSLPEEIKNTYKISLVEGPQDARKINILGQYGEQLNFYKQVKDCVKDSFDDILITQSFWSADEWDTIIDYLKEYVTDYEYDSDDNIIAHCETETEWYDLHTFLNKLGN